MMLANVDDKVDNDDLDNDLDNLDDTNDENYVLRPTQYDKIFYLMT
jgi:hypothetical protein